MATDPTNPSSGDKPDLPDLFEAGIRGEEPAYGATPSGPVDARFARVQTAVLCALSAGDSRSVDDGFKTPDWFEAPTSDPETRLGAIRAIIADCKAYISSNQDTLRSQSEGRIAPQLLQNIFVALDSATGILVEAKLTQKGMSACHGLMDLLSMTSFQIGGEEGTHTRIFGAYLLGIVDRLDAILVEEIKSPERQRESDEVAGFIRFLQQIDQNLASISLSLRARSDGRDSTNLMYALVGAAINLRAIASRVPDCLSAEALSGSVGALESKSVELGKLGRQPIIIATKVIEHAEEIHRLLFDVILAASFDYRDLLQQQCLPEASTAELRKALNQPADEMFSIARAFQGSQE